jgi:hypothetical protein
MRTRAGLFSLTLATGIMLVVGRGAYALNGTGGGRGFPSHPPLHGPGSSHNPIVKRPPVHGPGSSHNPIVAPRGGYGGHH